MFRRRKAKECFDREKQRPVIRASICTGEQVAGFKDIHTGKFTEVTVIRNDRDLQAFLEDYGITAEEIKKEW